MTSLLAALVMLMAAENLSSGDHRRDLTVDRLERHYLVHVPNRNCPRAGWPVVLIFHGGASNVETMVTFTGMSEKADEAGFLAVYPSGTGRTDRLLTFNGGNCCGRAMMEKVDDVKFVWTVLSDLESVVKVDKKRVFATGMSNGAIMCYLLASEMADRIAAIAPVAGPMGTANCSPNQPVSVCHFHGTNDAFAPLKGGRGSRSISRTDFYSVEHSIQAWVKANGCKTSPDIASLPKQVDDGTSVTRATYRGGRQGTEVVLYTIDGMGHTWPGRENRLRFLGATTKNISANDVMWEFFREHARK